MIYLLFVLIALVLIIEIASMVVSVKSANRKARYTMIEVKALRQVRDQIEKLSKR